MSFFSDFWRWVEGNGDEERDFMYRTTFVIKLPVTSRWKVCRRQIFSYEKSHVDFELALFLEKVGQYIGSRAYAMEADVGIEKNTQIEPTEEETIDDFYDAGGT